MKNLTKIFVVMLAGILLCVNNAWGDEIYSYSFTSQGDWTIDNKNIGSLSYVWTASSYNTSYYMKASAYVSSTKTNNAAESWLVSPEIDMSGYSDISLSFSNTYKFAASPSTNNLKVKVSTDGTNWTELSYTQNATGSDYTFADATADLSSYKSSHTQIAFVYISTTSYAPTWEIASVTITGTSSVTYTDYITECRTTLTYDINGGTGTTPASVSTFPATLNNGTGFSRTGYNFAGWNTQADGNGTNYAGGTNLSIDDALTLYAKWTAKTTAVTINSNTSNHGTGSNVSVTATYDQALPSFTAIKPATGYSLLGYYTAATGGTKVINADGTLVASVSGYTNASAQWAKEDASFTLYAQFEAVDYTITKQTVSNGTITVSATSAHYGDNITLEATPATGYSFSSWSVIDASSNTVTVTNDHFTMPASNVTVSATFTAKSYTLTFLNNGDSYATKTQNYGTSVTKPTDPTPCTGYTFVGWSESQQATESTSSPTIATIPTTMPAANTTYYAVYSRTEGGGGVYSGVTGDYSFNLASFSGNYETSGDPTTAKNEQLVASNSPVSFTAEQNGSTKVTNYIGGNSTYTHTRFYTSNILTFDAGSGNTIKSITFTATSAGYVVASTDFGNGNSSVSGSTQTITMTAASQTYSVTLNGGCRLTSIKVSLGDVSSSTTYYTTSPNCCDLQAVTSPAFVSNAAGKGGTISWTAPSSLTGINSYTIYNVTTSSNVATGVDKSSTSYSISGLTECTSYTFIIKSVGASCDVSSSTFTGTPYSGAKTVTFNYNGGSGSTASASTSCGQTSVTLPTPASRSHFTFNGWFTAASGGTMRGGAGDTYAPSSSETLYAQWTEDTKYTINFTSAHGTPSPASVSDKYAGDVVSLQTMTAAGYVFGGWRIGSTTYAGGANYTVAAADATGTTIAATAQWSTPSITASNQTFTAAVGQNFNQTFSITSSLDYQNAYTVTSSNSKISVSHDGNNVTVSMTAANATLGTHVTTLTFKTAGMADVTCTVTINVLNNAVMTLSVTNLNNGLICNEAATITTSAFYTAASTIYTGGWGQTGTYTLYNISDGTNITTGFTGAISNGVVTITVPTTKMAVGNRYKLAWTNTQNLTDASGLKYADAESAEFVFTDNCDAPTALDPCVTGPNSAVINWAGTCAAANSTVSVYTKETSTITTQQLATTTNITGTSVQIFSTSKPNNWMSHTNSNGGVDSYGYKMSTKLYGPAVSNWNASITTATEWTVTIKAYNGTSNSQTLTMIVCSSIGSSGGSPTAKSVTINGATGTSVALSIPSNQYGEKTFTIKGLDSSDRFFFSQSGLSGNFRLHSVKVESVTTTAVKTISNATCANGKQEVSGLTANTTYYTSVTNNGKTSNEVSFKTYTSAGKSIRFYSDAGCTSEITPPLQTPSGQDVTVYVKGINVPGCDVSTMVTSGISFTDNTTFNNATGALTGNIVLHNNTVEGDASLTITDGQSGITTLALTASSCPSGFNTMATAATDITANSANANWTGSVTSNAGTLVLYKNGLVNRELIENGGFESDLTSGWSNGINKGVVGAVHSFDTYAVASSNAKSGSKCLYVSEDGSALTNFHSSAVIYGDYITFEPGRYRMTAWVKMPVYSGYSNKTSDFSLGLISGTASNEKVTCVSAVTTVQTNNTYVQLSYEFELATSVKACPCIGAYSSTFHPFYLDDVSLVRIAAPQNDEPYMNYDIASLSAGTQALSGLSGNTSYTYKLVNDDGCESNEITFATLAAGEPQITVVSPVEISAPIGSSNSGVARVTVTDAFDVVTITGCGDDRITLASSTLPAEGGVLRFTFSPKNTDSPGDNGTCQVSFITRGKTVPTTLDINWTISAGIDLNTELIEVTDISNSDITVEHNVPGTVDEVRVVFNRELEPDEVEENVGDEVFFSKYYEAYMHKKLWAIYNPTMREISLEGMQVWRSTSDGWNTAEAMDLSEMGNVRSGYISPFEEIIIYTADQVGSCEEAAADMTEWTPMSSTDRPLSFSGDDALLLVRKVSAEDVSKGNVRPAASVNGTPISWPDAITVDGESWHPLDIIGARTDAWLPDASATYKWNWTNCKTDVSESGDDKGWVGYGYDMSDNKSNYSTCTGGGYLLSTNRCLLVRRMDVKSGANALAINVGNMHTLNSEWKGSHVPTSGDQAQVSCDNFSYVGGYDYTGYYNHYTPMDESEYIPLGQNPDGTWSFEVNVPGYYCKNLRIEVVEKQTINGVDADNIHAYTDYKVPIVVDVDKTTAQLVSGGLTSSICEECDVVVRNAAQLSHILGGQGTFRDMYVYPGAKLSNEVNKTINLRSIYMQSDNDVVSYAIVNNNASTILSDKVIHTKRIDNAYWYPFSLPYDCSIASIRQLNGKSLGKYEGPGVVDPSQYGDWTIKYYDGEARQTAGTSAAPGEDSPYWVEMPANGTLKANQAYIIGMYTLADNHKMTVLFPPKDGSAYVESGDEAKTTTVVNWPANLSSEPQHHGWNFVGSPYISMFNEGSNEQGLNNATMLMTGEFNGEEYIHTENVYVSIPDGGNSRTYTQVLASATKLKPFTGYFVQVVDPTTGSSENKTLTYAKAGRTLVSAPARSASLGNKRIHVELNLSSADGLSDNAGIVLDEIYDNTYNIGGDLTKMYAQAAKPQLFLLDSVSAKMAYLAVHPDASSYIPLGFYAPTSGEYSLSIRSEVSRLGGVANVLLLENGQIVADLLLGDYIVQATAGLHTEYTINIVRAPQVPTDVSNIGNGSGYSWVIQNGQLTLVGLSLGTEVRLYDAVGHLMDVSTADGTTLTLNAPATGVYLLQVGDSLNKLILNK